MCLKSHLSIFWFPFSFPVPTPRSVLRASNNEDLFFLQFCSYKCVLSIFIYNIALQNTDFGVLQKSSKHFLISIFFQMGRGDTPLPHPPPARHFLPRTRASPLSMTIHAPPSTKSWIRHCISTDRCPIIRGFTVCLQIDVLSSEVLLYVYR